MYLFAQCKTKQFENLFAPIAQLDRALDYESRGREFESSRARRFSELLPHFNRQNFKYNSKGHVDVN